MRRIPKPIAIAGYTAAALMIAAGGMFFAQSAGAAVINDDPDGAFSLDANPYPFSYTTFSPGSTQDWLITAQLGGTENAALTLQLDYSGVLATDPAGLDLLVVECSTPFAGPPASCGGTETTIYEGAFASAPMTVQDLGTMVAGTNRYFLANFTLPIGTPDSMQGQDANFRFTFVAANDSENVNNLPRTGGVDLVGPLLLGGGLVLGGIMLARQRAGRAAELAAIEQGVQR
jgi:hypothetical protein